MRPRFRRRDFALQLLQRSLAEFFDDNCPQLAASIAYHVLFSLFPLTMVVAGAASISLNASGTRVAAVDAVVGNLPLSVSGTRQLRDVLLGATGGTATLGAFGVIGLVYAASGMMASLRAALNQAWDVEAARPFLKGKLIDLALVLLVATVGLGSLALTFAAGRLGASSGLPGWITGALGIEIPFAVVFAAVVVLYLCVPAAAVRFTEIWPAALLVAALVVATQNLFALYVRNFGHYNVLYGSLGAVVAFMFFVYLAAEFLLLGAEVASEWPRVANALAHGSADDGGPFVEQLKAALVGLWVRRGETDKDSGHDEDDQTPARASQTADVAGGRRAANR